MPFSSDFIVRNSDAIRAFINHFHILFSFHFLLFSFLILFCVLLSFSILLSFFFRAFRFSFQHFSSFSFRFLLSQTRLLQTRGTLCRAPKNQKKSKCFDMECGSGGCYCRFRVRVRFRVRIPCPNLHFFFSSSARDSVPPV